MTPSGALRRCALLLALLAPLHAKPLNVVFIIADDLGYGEIGCFGQEKIRTPHLDRIAREGARLTQHLSGAPVCAPARCTLLTGKHLGHADIRGNRQASVSFPQFKEGQHPIRDETLTLAEVFRKNGYRTAAIGKWGLGPVHSTGDPNRQGFELFFGYNCQAVAHSYYPATLWRNDRQIPFNQPAISGHHQPVEAPVKAETFIGKNYAPDAMIREAETFIRDHAAQPFFLYLAFIEPHVALHPPLDRLDQYPASWDSQPYLGGSGYLPHPRPRAAYATMISDLDRHVGAVRAALEKAGILDDTLIVFTSDNGTTHAGNKPAFHVGGCDAKFFNSTANLRGYKGSLYEGGLRVPTLVRLPGKIPAGHTSEAASWFPDWFPTLCEAAAIPAPRDLDGISLWRHLTAKAPLERPEPMVWAFPEYGGQVAVRFPSFKAVRQKLNQKKPGPWEVYDLRNDPSESRDLAAEHPEVIRQAEAVLAREVSENSIFPVKLPPSS